MRPERPARALGCVWDVQILAMNGLPEGGVTLCMLVEWYDFVFPFQARRCHIVSFRIDEEVLVVVLTGSVPLLGGLGDFRRAWHYWLRCTEET